MSPRDPDGYVFRRHGRVFRAISERSYRTLQKVFATEMWRCSQQSGDTVATAVLSEEERRALKWTDTTYPILLEHQLIAPWSYPEEWTIGMLADAALLTLRLQRQLSGIGFSLKDATPYNIQFVRGQPQLIDITSIEQPARSDIWYALGQFQRTFTYPMLLAAHRGWTLKAYFCAYRDGMSERQMLRACGRFGYLRPALLLDVTLPALAAGFNGPTVAAIEAERGRQAMLFNLGRLHRKLERISRQYKCEGSWQRYNSSCSYEGDEQAKLAIVTEWLRRYQPGAVCDAGCNTGEYSFAAAKLGAKVTALDADHDAVERLYRRLVREPADITPMVADLVNPTPAGGLLNRERQGLLQRLDCDCVLALALLHHLVIGASLPLEAVRDLLVAMTRRLLILEVIPADDVMVAHLMRNRQPLDQPLSMSRVTQVFSERFRILESVGLPHCGRSLMLLTTASAPHVC